MRVQGLVRSIRKQKNLAFAHISDGTTVSALQACLTPEQAHNLTNGCFVELVGSWQESPGKGQSHELGVTRVVHVGGSVAEDNPIQKQQMTNEYLRTIPHLRVRTPHQALVARARSKVIDYAHTFFAANNTTYVHPPLITSSDCEGAGDVFTVSSREILSPNQAESSDSSRKQSLYFGSPKYLTVSSQLHLEAYSAELGDVWTLSPTFRAEPSDTSRHLSEFYMLEAEFRSVETLTQLMQEVQQLILFIAKRLQEDGTGEELATMRDDVDLQERWQALMGPWELATYSEVMSELESAFRSSRGSLFTHPPSWEKGLQLEHEKWATATLARNRPLFVTDYPAAIKPFYMLPTSVTPEEALNRTTASCFDLLLPFGHCEVVGGSMREHRLEDLISAMRTSGLLGGCGGSSHSASNYPSLRRGESLGNLQWYADLRRFGSSPHGGYGLGFDRLLAYLSGQQSVRDVVGFPRHYGRADC